MSQSQESQWFGPSQDESQCDEDVTNTFKALPAHSAFVRLSQGSSFNDAAPTPADASGVTRITASASSSERGSAVDAAPREAPAATPRPAVAPPPPRAAATVCRPVAAPPADEPVPVCYACRVATAPDLDDEGRQRVKPPSAKDVREKAPERLLWRCPQCEKTLIGCAYRCGACYTLANFTGCRRHETHKCRRNPSRVDAASDGAAAAVPHAAAVVESESSSESSDDGREDSSGPAPHPSAGVFASLWAAGRRGGRVDAAVPLRVARTGDGTWDLAAGAPRATNVWAPAVAPAPRPPVEIKVTLDAPDAAGSDSDRTRLDEPGDDEPAAADEPREPPARRDEVELLARRDDVEPPTQRDEVEPPTRRDEVEPATQRQWNDSAEPPTQRQWAAEAPPADDDADRWSDGSGFALPRRESVDAVEAAPPRDGGDDDFPRFSDGGDDDGAAADRADRAAGRAARKAERARLRERKAERRDRRERKRLQREARAAPAAPAPEDQVAALSQLVAAAADGRQRAFLEGFAGRVRAGAFAAVADLHAAIFAEAMAPRPAAPPPRRAPPRPRPPPKRKRTPDTPPKRAEPPPYDGTSSESSPAGPSPPARPRRLRAARDRHVDYAGRGLDAAVEKACARGTIYRRV